MSLSAERLLSEAAMLPVACLSSIPAAGCIRAAPLLFSRHFQGHFLHLAEFLSLRLFSGFFRGESSLDHLSCYLRVTGAPCLSSQARAGAKKFRKVTLTVSPKGIIVTDTETADLMENVSIYR